MEIGYLGPNGTFTEQAAFAYCPQAKTVKFQSFGDILSAVAAGQIENGIVAIENSIEGTVNATLDGLIFDTDVFIKAQLTLSVSENLMANPGQCRESITKILSHPQPLGQCRKFLNTNFSGVELIPVSSTAEAARMVSKSAEPMAAIATGLAADLYGLEILQSDIQDEKQNYTTFVIVSKEDLSTPKAGHKTSIAFSTVDKPGALYRILDIFSIWDINITKILSRPMKGKPGEYVFYVDLDGFEDPHDVCDALLMVQRKTSFYKTLGSYPVIQTLHKA